MKQEGYFIKKKKEKEKKEKKTDLPEILVNKILSYWTNVICYEKGIKIKKNESYNDSYRHDWHTYADDFSCYV